MSTLFNKQNYKTTLKFLSTANWKVFQFFKHTLLVGPGLLTHMNITKATKLLTAYADPESNSSTNKYASRKKK